MPSILPTDAAEMCTQNDENGREMQLPIPFTSCYIATIGRFLRGDNWVVHM